MKKTIKLLLALVFSISIISCSSDDDGLVRYGGADYALLSIFNNLPLVACKSDIDVSYNGYPASKDVFPMLTDEQKSVKYEFIRITSNSMKYKIRINGEIYDEGKVLILNNEEMELQSTKGQFHDKILRKIIMEDGRGAKYRFTFNLYDSETTAVLTYVFSDLPDKYK